MVALRLPENVERRLEALAASTGVSANAHAERAIANDLGDLEDHEAADRETGEVRAGRSATMPLAEMLKRHGVADEVSSAAGRSLAAPDRVTVGGILRFCEEPRNVAWR